MSHFTTKEISGEAFISTVCHPDPDGNNEVQHVQAVEIDFLSPGRDRHVKHSIHLDLSGFKNAIGQTVCEVVAEKWEALEYLIAQQDERERQDAEEASTIE